jgi:hypothetical protein
VIAVATTPVLTPVAVTVTPGIRAFVASSMVPLMAPLVDCPNIDAAKISDANNPVTIWVLVLTQILLAVLPRRNPEAFQSST